MTATKAPFKPTAVLITPDAEWQDGNQTRVDPEKVTLLHLDSDENSGWLYTHDEWENDREPRIYRRYGEHEGLREGERVELLPDMWIVKIDEREYWLDPKVLDRTSRIFGVYVFDRRNMPIVVASRLPMSVRFSEPNGTTAASLPKRKPKNLTNASGKATAQCESSNYFDVADVDRMIAETCREGFLPAGNAGGFKVEVKSVVTDDAIAEIGEAYCQSEL